MPLAFRLRIFALSGIFASHLCGIAVAGPPFVTDDPVPTEFRNWEIYGGGTYENDGHAGDYTSLPFLELNYGALPNVQVSATFPITIVNAGLHTTASYGDTELGVKVRFLQESASSPQISVYPSIELPTSGSGVARTFLPLWLQKSFGRWTMFGGGGVYLNTPRGDRGSSLLGIAALRSISPATSLGAEIFHGPTASNGSTQSGFNVGALIGVRSIHAIVLSAGRAFNGPNSLMFYGAYEFALGPQTTRSTTGDP